MEKQNKNIILDFEPISRRFFLSLDKNLYEMLIKSGIQIQSLCGGKGTCGKCKLMIQKGIEFFNPPTEADKNFIGKEELEKGWRLGCQTYVNVQTIENLEREKTPQFRIFLPDELLVEDFKILTSGINKQEIVNPNIKKYFLEINKPTLDDSLPDFDRVLSTLYSQKDLAEHDNLNIPLNLLKKLPDLLRANDFKITLGISSNKNIISIEGGNNIDNNYGIAIDIGTTTLVGYLINLNNGRIYGVSSKLNPQTAFGEDVVTRLTYIKDKEEGLSTLNSSVISALNDIIQKTSKTAKINPSQISEAVIVGNSVMHHIFLGLNPENIGYSPFIPVIQQGINVKAKDVKLNILENGNVYALPTIAGFVGADTMGVIISSDIDKEEDLTLAIDIGTNGEIIIGNKNILATGSCAAGSALEGAHINDGMRAAAGSIDTIKINPDTLEPSLTTIKNKKPIGICGSGLIDLVAEMLKSKIITRSGNFNKNLYDHERMIVNDNDKQFIVVKKEETNIGRNILISQGDIRQIQMAKAAFYAGSEIILKYLDNGDRELKDIKQIFLAGAFGNYINKESAKFIGMIPDISSDKIFQIGNAAGIGAQNCLLNRDLRIKANELLKDIQYVEIATKKEFQRKYAEAMYFPHLKLDYFTSLKEYKDISLR